ncbi:MAG TPA: nuclear transport factor 2 family protein [Steroidobacteraceae bacterium]|nr:nuclear transport factor 2 family protein [Steroidobacteraceae bacterium]
MKTRSIPSRRAFLYRAGASLTGSLAVVAGSAAAESADPLAAQARTGASEEAHSPRTLHRAYANYLNAGTFDLLLNLFSSDAEVRLHGGVFAGRDEGIRRLYVGHSRQTLRPEPVHELLLEHPLRDHALVLATDAATAAARFHCLVRSRAALVQDLPLLEMARQQGQSSVEWWEAGCFENTYVLTAGRWQIAELRYRTLGNCEALVPHARGKPDFVPGFSMLYPRDPFGPDRLDRQSA